LPRQPKAEPAGPPGLIRIVETWRLQGFAEAWLDWRDSPKLN